MRTGVGGFAVAMLIASTAFCQTNDPVEGFSHPYRTANVAAATAGIVHEWLVEEGEFVSTGQPLVRLDDTLHRELLEIAKAAVEARGEIELAEAEQALRQQRLAAIEALSAQGHATPDELFRAQSEAKVAAARLRTALERQLQHQLEYRKLKVQAETYTITAPFDGVITQVHKLKGEYVGPIDPEVCQLAGLKTISARFLLPHARVGDLQTGEKVKVWFPAEKKEFEGAATMSPYPDAETGMRTVKVKIANRDGVLKPGQPCTLRLKAQTRKADSSG